MAKEVHQAAVRLPPAEPSERHFSRGPATLTCPVGNLPVAPPSTSTSTSRAPIPPMPGQGWLGRHMPSISLAATPASRMRGPSAHHIGPSPSHTAVGVQVKVCPAATMASTAIIRSRFHRRPDQACENTPGRQRELERHQLRGLPSSWRSKSLRREARSTPASAMMVLTWPKTTCRHDNDSHRFFDHCGSPVR